ncbi:MAG: hypothetical protein HOE14_12215 [Gemmatimonadales bacterium]|nr:hypothetical protein [Gemmatimonadales bacterium]
MTTDIPDLFADPAPPVEHDTAAEELSRWAAVISDLRNGGGVWAMVLGHPEPERSDPFKPEGEWVDLDERLWTVSSTDFAWWAGHAHPTVRRIVAMHEACAPELLDRLAEDPWIEIRQAALDTNAVDPTTVSNAAESETVDWLREALGEQDPVVTGRCGLCGRRVKRPDRFLTCSIRCSIDQANDRLKDGHYLRGGRSSSWPLEYMWSVARFKASGGIRGTGPKFWNVRLSFIPGLNAVECDRVVSAVCDLEDLGVEQAVEALDQMTRTLDGPDILDALGMGHKT